MKICTFCQSEFDLPRRTTCSDECRLAMIRQHQRKKYYNDFLPPDEESNVIGYWVPTPEQIEAACVELRNSHTDERDWRELTSRQRRMLFSQRQKELSKKGENT
jgi:hypothetical protein